MVKRSSETAGTSPARLLWCRRRRRTAHHPLVPLVRLAARPGRLDEPRARAGGTYDDMRAPLASAALAVALATAGCGPLGGSGGGGESVDAGGGHSTAPPPGGQAPPGAESDAGPAAT